VQPFHPPPLPTQLEPLRSSATTLHLNALTPCIGGAARIASALSGSGLTLKDYFEPTEMGPARTHQPWCLAVFDAPSGQTLERTRQILNARLAQQAGLHSFALAEVTPALNTDPGTPSFDADCQNQDALQREASTSLPLALEQLPTVLGGRIDPRAGQGFTVAVIDGGVRGQAVARGSRTFLGTEAANRNPGDITDRFDCAGTPFLDGHGSSVTQIIRTLSPGADLLALKACDDQGRCPTTSVAKALLYLHNRYTLLPEVSVVNMSFGGLPGSGDPVIAAILRDMSNTLPNTLFLSAAGNVRDAAGHFPADLLREVNTLVPIAAAKRVLNAPGWVLADFNTWATWANKNIVPLAAPGVRLRLRLDNVDRELTGSSFATPVAAALAANKHHAGESAVEMAVELRRDAQNLGGFLLTQMK